MPQPSTKSLRSVKLQKFKFIALIALIVVAFIVVDQFDILSEDNIFRWQAFIDELGWGGPLIFIGIYTLGAVLFLPGTAFTILGGAAFGLFGGIIYSVIGATTGALAAHFVARLLGEDFVSERLQGRIKNFSMWQERIQKNGLLTVIILRITPLIPYNGLNFALAYTKVRTPDLVLGTALGIIPSIVAYVVFGGAVTSLSATNLGYATVGIVVYMALSYLLAKRMQGDSS